MQNDLINLNSPKLWARLIPEPGPESHKYTRGHAVILGGRRMTGAARLASEAAMRTGAGMCSIVADATTADVYRSGAPHILFESLESPGDFPAHMADERRRAALLGPGAGRDDDEALRQAVIGTLKTGKPVVLDADALNVFERHRQELFSALHDNAVLTPHEGEFSRLFPDITGSPLEKCAAAAGIMTGVMVLKGAETVIAQEDRQVVNVHSTPWLASAGTGDVLAGMILGLLAQGMPVFEAACAAVWIHGETGLRIGQGLVATDLTGKIPEVLQEIRP